MGALKSPAFALVLFLCIFPLSQEQDLPSCQLTDFHCKDQTACVPHAYQCDGQSHCRDASDEIGCDAGHKRCQAEKKFLCHDLSACISDSDVCDSHRDCDDGSDEIANCEEKCHALKCGIHSRCALLASGDVQCVCRTGYQENSELECVDVDECERTLDSVQVCSHTCYNTPGSFLCFCDMGYHLAPDKRTCLVDGEDPWLVYATRHSIVTHNMRSRHDYTLLEKASSIQGLAIDFEGQRLFWTESEVSTQPAVFVASLDNISETKQPVAKFGLSKPRGLAFDPRQKNLYIADTGLPAILACRKTKIPSHVLSNKVTGLNSAHSQFMSLLGELNALDSQFSCVTVYNQLVLSNPTELVLNHRDGPVKAGGQSCCAFFLFSKGIRPSEIHKQIAETYGEVAKSRPRVYQWCNWFGGGRTSLNDEPKYRRPKTSTNEENTTRADELIKCDRKIKISEIALKFEIPTSTVHEKVHDTLGYLKVSARWVPKMITEDHKLQRVEFHERLLLRCQQDNGDEDTTHIGVGFGGDFQAKNNLFDNMIAGDETWVRLNTPETKRDFLT
ncbi:low-density lipoprotein receptor [Elysia marginata]|uniref:Low-density lipoprotein receptor n=1 Tax=Elysia marginata TaxID=1093978 RepID=A0AAV4HSP5_9GAST|nr:low-density lipoprotein receptor [Elysia marginata]